jgi:hypothetical protein
MYYKLHKNTDYQISCIHIYNFEKPNPTNITNIADKSVDSCILYAHHVLGEGLLNEYINEWNFFWGCNSLLEENEWREDCKVGKG